MVCYLILAITYSCEEYCMDNCWPRTRLEMCYDLVVQVFGAMSIPAHGLVQHPAYASAKLTLACLFPGQGEKQLRITQCCWKVREPPLAKSVDSCSYATAS